MKIKSSRKKRFAILRLSAIIFTLLSLVGLFVGNTKQTYADGVSLSESDIKAYEQNIFYKVEYNNLKRCYSKLANPIERGVVDKISDALTEDIELTYPFFITGPSYWDDTTKTSCEILLGDQKLSSFLDGSGGFQAMEESDKSRKAGKKCFYVTASLNDAKLHGKTYRTGDYCVATDSDGNIKEDTIEYLFGGGGNGHSNDGGSLVNKTNAFHLEAGANRVKTNISVPRKNGENKLCFDIKYLEAGEMTASNVEYPILYNEAEQCEKLPMTYDSFEGFVSTIVKTIKIDNGENKLVFDGNTVKVIDSTTDKGIKKVSKGDNSGADNFANKFLKITKGIDIKNGQFSDAEKYIMYRNALKSFYKVGTDYNGEDNVVSWLEDNYTFTDNVYLTPTANISNDIYVPYSSRDVLGITNSDNGYTYYWRDYKLGVYKIIGEISKINVEEAFKEKPTALIVDGTNKDSDYVEDDVCYTNGGALGWIICPVIGTMRNMIDWVYEKFEDWLQINPNIVENLSSTNNSNGLFSAWATFRNIANIAFVILFMIIIFSQLTGYGIDNYGIKRMLPKLIITAILVNLSYIICGLLVDISNIVGNSVKGLFENMAENNAGSALLGGSSTTAVSKVVVLVCGAGVAVLGVGALVKGGLLPILLFVVAMAIGAFTILVILGVRQALAVALIVASPLAFVCMILPNTEGIYKKWLNAFKGLLIVYPIIGAVIGAGYFAASIFINTSDGGITAIIAGILMIAPYFMIPSLTRKSLDAIGSIGSRISNFGQRGSSRAQSGVRSSNFGKSMQQNHEYKQAKRYMEGGLFRKKFKIDSRGKKLADKINAGKKVSIRSANKYQQMANLASAKEQANIGARTAQSKYSRLQNTGYDASLSAAASAEEDAAIKDYETQIRNGDFNAAFMKEVKNKDGKIEKKLITDRAPEGDNELAAALEYELKLGQAADKNKIIALQNVLSKTDGGRNAMVESINSALQERDGNGNRIVSSTSVKALASNIMANQGDYKGVHRSIYEWAKDVLKDKNRKDDTTEVNMGSITGIDRTSGIQALTPSSFLSTDATQMQQYVEFYKNSGNRIKEIENQLKNGKITEEDANTEIEAINNKRIRLEEIAHSIAYNPNVHSSIRKDDYGDALKLFAADIPWDNVFSGRGVEVQISHDNETQPVSVQTQQISQPTQPAQTQQTSQPQQSQQPTPTQTQQTSQPEPTQAQPVDNTNSINSVISKFNQSFEQQDYNNRLKEETARRDDLSDESKKTLNDWINNSNNQNPNNS